MKTIVKSAALTLCVGLGLTTVILMQERNVQDNPFVNLFVTIGESDWRDGRLRGDISDYQSPIVTGGGPDGGWGDRSVHFEASFPLEDDLVGHSSDGDLVLYCYQHSLVAIQLYNADIPTVHMPPAVLKAALDETVTHPSRYSHDDGQIYVRQCYTTLMPRDPEFYHKNKGLSNSEGFYLFDQCIDEVQNRFRGVENVAYDAENGAFSMLRVASVDSAMGTTIGALCRQTVHPSGFLHVYTWFLPTPP